MHTGRIAGATRTLGAPVDWEKEKQGVCGSLAIRDEQSRAGPVMTSAWYPTENEMKRIAAGAAVYVTVVGTVHPPLAVWVSHEPVEPVE